MSLETYNSKRSFSKTPEPTGGQPDNSKLQFVVQKHAASHLHYDFRLEVRGVLISWAVPKGPSMKAGENRLAMQTEDHPFDYLHFEGIIPKGQYGGGTVIVWDAGTFETTLIKDKDKKAQEHSLLSQYYKGKITFTLHGTKLKGKFEISRAKDKDEKSWYLVKQPDRYVLKSDIIKKDMSALSGRTIEQVAEDPNAAAWQSNRTGKPEKSAKSESDLSDVPGAVKAPMPNNLAPMECRLIQKPFNEPGWIYELKLDGYRVLSWCKNGEVKLQSRGGLNYTKDYEVLLTPLKSLGKDFIIDGEIVVLNENGHPDFDALQRYRRNKAAAQLVYYVFDLVWLDGYDLMGVKLENRRKILRELVRESDYIRFSEDLKEGFLMFDVIKESGLEGIIYKAKDSLYQPGKRGNYWLKLPTSIQQEFVIGGWTESGSGHAFRSLVFGAYENGSLTYIGHAGHGFKDEDRKGILNRLKKLEVIENPFVNEVDTDTPVHFVNQSWSLTYSLRPGPLPKRSGNQRYFLDLGMTSQLKQSPARCR
ncbi:hypothetical protein EXU57_24125 [Segetibacter sp. 3557_3]|uniref:DNA polymerase ligase N-terminal domain-containing protein n=1 Tax=Segetibacter sp. 3557_3 TaxID=2547429 RepID=UPI001058995C|nr:DNA polymerase ligase N-terminal domain-containing protein [Segetibacter sp. 3557_3]TDH18269.1 hypothetical protein EXU57_24125 [Segetibacter sp. 3557_3]